MGRKKRHRARRSEIVWLEWVDSSVVAEWVARDAAAKESYAKCVSVGLVIHKPKKDEPWWTISGDMADCGGVSRTITIPEVAVRKVRVLELKALPRPENRGSDE